LLLLAGKNESQKQYFVSDNIAMFKKNKTITQRKVVINAQGTRYETLESTLQLFPETLLGDWEVRMRYYSASLNAHYFDVKPELFEAVLFFYQSNGILSKPTFASDIEYKKTLEFFGLIKSNNNRPYLDSTAHSVSFRELLWDILEHPHRSKKGLYSAISFTVILLSVGMFCMETEMHRGKSHTIREVTSPWFVGECIYICFFTLEYLARLWSAPNRLRFAFSFLGVIDFLSILPFYLAFFNSYFMKISNLRILRLLQILRIIKLSRYNTGLKILAQAILSCRRQMFSLTTLFCITIIFVSTFVYVAEYDGVNLKKGFESIPSTMWYAVISMTTVGYGDVVPLTALGKLCGAIGIFLGTVVLFHLFLPIYLTHFAIFYEQEKQRAQLRNEYKKCKKTVTLQNVPELADSTHSIPQGMVDFRRARTITKSSYGTAMSYSDSSSSMQDLAESDGNYHLAVPVRKLTTGTSSYVQNQFL
jgi:Kef-type K+ transport systems, predicted NAD-binding component